MTLRVDLVDVRVKLRAFLREHTLDALWLIHQGNNTQRGISRELNVDITKISKILLYLQTERYITTESTRSPFSGRPQNNYYLTEKGEALLRAIETINEVTSTE